MFFTPFCCNSLAFVHRFSSSLHSCNRMASSVSFGLITSTQANNSSGRSDTAGAGSSITVFPLFRASFTAYITVSRGISSCTTIISLASSKSIFSMIYDLSTCAFAPGITSMLLSPSGITPITAIPVDTPLNLRIRETSTPTLSRFSHNLSPYVSCPTIPSIATFPCIFPMA